MKICVNCGTLIPDDAKICPHCKKNTSKKILFDGNLKMAGRGNMNGLSESSKLTLIILEVIFLVSGTSLLIIFLVKEMLFRNNYDLSKRTEIGVKVLRNLTGNDLNIPMIIVGIILVVMASIIGCIPSILKKYK